MPNLCTPRNRRKPGGSPGIAGNYEVLFWLTQLPDVPSQRLLRIIDFDMVFVGEQLLDYY
jgi:hypothetical protein